MMASATLDEMPSSPTQAPSVDDSGQWLAAGWADFRANLVISLGYGLVFGLAALAMFLVLDSKEQGALFIPLAGGYLIISPILTVGFHEISRRRERGEAMDFSRMFTCCKGRVGQLALVGLVLAMLFMFWMLAAVLDFAVFFSAGVPWEMEPFLSHILTAPQTAPFLIIGTIAGGVIATIAYAVSALSIPMILDRNASAIDAMIASVKAVRANWRVMSGWAAMIALLTFCGMAVFFVGLAVTLPIAAHASWHAYRGLLGSAED
ncbi:conserved membrane protein of unknown function [Magnetospira sp. QH-2]|nr:conserved membrane protein of unknown function [Magnetospira sp. QH-2]